MQVDFDVGENRGWAFLLKELTTYVLWTSILARSDRFMLKRFNDVFVSSKHTQDINWWTGVVWITCELLWCFYQLFGLILTAPIHCRASIGDPILCWYSNLEYSINFCVCVCVHWHFVF